MRKYVLSTTGMTLVMLVLFSAALVITLSDLKHQQTVNSDAAEHRGPLADLPKVRVHHPLHDFTLRTKVMSFATTPPGTGFTPADIKKAYNLPSSGGHGTIAIVDAFDSPTAETDLNAFSTQFNLPACTTANGCFKKVNQTGGSSYPLANAGWANEIDLDIEWAHAIAPDAKILLIEANSDANLADFVAGIDYARNQPAVIAVSMSWGAPEFPLENNYEGYFVSPTGAAFFAASGDFGHGTFWPAVSPNVIGVGGTSLTISGTTITETAWSKSGGGQSLFMPEPSYQTAFNVPNAQGKRAMPDVSLIADPNTGALYYAPDGWHKVGGTSLSSPIWAAISALGTTPLTHTLLYQNAKTNYAGFYRDVKTGSNGLCGTYCTASIGFDYVTGVGSLIAMPLIGPVSPTPTVAPSPTPTPLLTPTPTPTVFLSPTPTAGVTLSPTPTPNSTGNTFTMQARQFVPHFVRVPVGTTVTWTNQDTVTHNTISDVTGTADSWNSGNIAPGQSFTKTFTTPGTYQFHCSIHPTMTGYVEVISTTSPTPSIVPSTTPNPNASTLSFALGLHGVGKGGDNANPTATGTSNPQHPTRQVTVTIFDLQNTQAGTGQGTLTFDSTSGLFNGTVPFNGLATGDYQLTIKVPGYLNKRPAQVIHVTAGQVTQVPRFNLVTGDIDNNNQLDILDYNLLVNCFGAKQNTASCTTPPTSQTSGSDLDDNAATGGSDYNLFLREVSVQAGG